MGTYRLYSGNDGQSHIETIDLDQTPDWKSAQDVTTISFSEAPAGRFSDWHPAPRRQFVIILSGQLEIGLGDGSKHVFGPGDARLVEDSPAKHTQHTTQTHPTCLLYTSPSPRDRTRSRMPSSA